MAELRRSSCIVHGTVAPDMSRPAARGARWQAEGPQAGPATSGRRLAPTTPTCSPIAPAVRHVEIGPSVTLVPHGWQLVIRKDAGHGRVGAFMLRHGSQRTPPSTMNSEPVEKLASSEATNSTRRVISSGSATHGIAMIASGAVRVPDRWPLKLRFDPRCAASQQP